MSHQRRLSDVGRWGLNCFKLAPSNC